MRSQVHLAFAVFLWSCNLSLVASQVLPPPGQPTKTGVPLQFEIVGNSGVSAQQMFVGTENKVYIVDKTENNPLRVDGHPAWGSEYALDTNAVRAMSVYSNSFCAGGASLGDGRWINVGGNQGVTPGGNTPPDPASTNPPYFGGAPYQDYDGGMALRLLTPCDDGSCQWIDDPKQYMTTRRWYPTVEPLEDGSVIIIGGDLWGGYVNSADQNNPTYEFFPSRGPAILLPILTTTLPANLFSLTWLLPSGRLFIQTNWGTEIYDYKQQNEIPLDNIPHAVRTYPASGATVMLPLTPANNYTAKILFCGGQNLQPEQFTVDWPIVTHPADTSCVTIEPDVDPKWKDDAVLPEGRTMGNFVLLPDGKIFLVNGGGLGTSGYGNDSWAIGHSYGASPIYAPLIYDPDPSVPVSRKLSRNGIASSTVLRLYHSSAVLLPDGSVFISGSNPNPDYTVGPNVKYPTEYRTERFYPWYYNLTRPQPTGLISPIGYGGSYFNVNLTKADLQDNAANVNTTKAIIIRTGFSTHGLSMGQRYLELATSYTLNLDGSATLHVAQLPPNPAIFPPGPAVVHIVVNGVPSVGKLIMVGSGRIENQTAHAVTALPPNFIPVAIVSTSAGATPSAHSQNPNGATGNLHAPGLWSTISCLVALVTGAALLSA